MDETVSRGPFPYEENVVFRDSTFFTRPNALLALPSPTEVREAASQSSNPNAVEKWRPPPVAFPGLGLLVKYGRSITIAEGQCLLFVRNTLSDVVPVPELYGWCKDDGQVFIYMELVDGITLEKGWETMTESERLPVCQQLREMINAWRGLKQDSAPPFIGHVGGQPLLDVIFTSSCSPTAGPFSSVANFHDWFTSSFGPYKYEPEQNRSPHPYRSFLPDDVTIVFTHSDLHPSNIMLSTRPNPRVLSIIDWHQFGWYPDYWEYCKARWTARIGGEWECKYLPKFLDPRDCYDYWDYFNLARGV